MNKFISNQNQSFTTSGFSPFWFSRQVIANQVFVCMRRKKKKKKAKKNQNTKPSIIINSFIKFCHFSIWMRSRWSQQLAFVCNLLFHSNENRINDNNKRKKQKYFYYSKQIQSKAIKAHNIQTNNNRFDRIGSENHFGTKSSFDLLTAEQNTRNNRRLWWHKRTAFPTSLFYKCIKCRTCAHCAWREWKKKRKTCLADAMACTQYTKLPR